MHIIFGKDEARLLQNKYTVLELDTFEFQQPQRVVSAYCIIENVGIAELPELDRMKNLHAELISNYAQQNWSFCIDAIEHLLGKWGGEMDTFYHDLYDRIQKYRRQILPDSGWSPVIQK